MLPKEKAEELVHKFMETKSLKLSDYSRIEFPTAKQCALICCDEMLNNAGFIWGEGRDTEIGLSARDAFRKYWSEVKEELLKM